MRCRLGKLVWLASMMWCLLANGVSAGDLPPGIANPDTAIKDPMYSDPVFFWRYTSRPDNPYEPDPYFYWPEGWIKGAPASFLPAAQGQDKTISAKALAKMKQWAGAHDSNVLIVVHNGTVQLETYWNDAGPGLLINGRAITRSVTPLLLGFAIAEKKLALNDPIRRYIPEWSGDKRGDILVKQLAQNVSGLEVAPPTPISQIYGNKDLCLVYCGDVVRAALAYDYARPPGTAFEVAQENMQLLALVIERAMEMPIQALLSERVWTKIGASDAAFQLDRPNGTARVMCCMRARAHDWVRLGLLIAQDGVWNGTQVIPKGWVQAITAQSKFWPRSLAW